MKTKLCRKCGDEKFLDEFSRSKTTKDGRYSLCKKCKSAYKKEHKAKNPERYLALNEGCRKRYEARHPDRVKAQQRKADEKRRARDALDPERIKVRETREAKKQDRTQHPEKYDALEREKSKAWWAENREKINAQRRDRYANDSVVRANEFGRDKRRRPQQNEAAKRRRVQNPGKYRAKERKSRHQRKGDMIAFELMLAANIIQSEFRKGIEDKNEAMHKMR